MVVHFSDCDSVEMSLCTRAHQEAKCLILSFPDCAAWHVGVWIGCTRGLSVRPRRRPLDRGRLAVQGQRRRGRPGRPGPRPGGRAEVKPRSQPGSQPRPHTGLQRALNLAGCRVNSGEVCASASTSARPPGFECHQAGPAESSQSEIDTIAFWRHKYLAGCVCVRWADQSS